MNKKTIATIIATSLLLIGCGETKEEKPKVEPKQETPKTVEKKETPKVAEPVVAKKVEPKKVAFDAKHTFNTKCASCHGTDASKSALGKSKIVSNMSKDEITNALKGYKAGTYGASMKSLMQGQVSKFNEKELESIAKYIATQK
jgi:cytochrome c553